MTLGLWAAMSKDKRKLAEDTLEALRHTIIEHFSGGQFHEVGIRDICQHAKVSPKTVYKYFGSKEDLLLACIETDLNNLTLRAESMLASLEDPRQRLHALVEAQLGFYAENPTIARIVFLNLPVAYWVSQQSEAQTRFQIISLHEISEAQRQGIIIPDIAPRMVQDITSGAVNRLITRWLLDGCVEDLPGIARPALRALEYGWFADSR